jgi:hypothetical protein
MGQQQAWFHVDVWEVLMPVVASLERSRRRPLDIEDNYGHHINLLHTVCSRHRQHCAAERLG